MNTQTEKSLSSHTAERTLYQVQVRRKSHTQPSVLLYERFIGTEWEQLSLPPRRYRMTEHVETAAELDDGLFPYALAMKEAWAVLACEHAYMFEVRLVPHTVKTSYASYPQEPMEKLDRNPK